MDPSKTHRVPNPTLKVFQRNAIQSYFERQQQQQQSIRLSKNGINKSDDLNKMKSIAAGMEPSQSTPKPKAPIRPQSLNLSISTSSSNLQRPATPSLASNQQSPISGCWLQPKTSPSSISPIVAGSNGSSNPENMMMKNANDIANMNMKNSAMLSAVAADGILSEKQLFASNKMNNKNQSISKHVFTSFCEIKTENYPPAFDIASLAAATIVSADNNCLNKTNLSTPPPLPRKNSILRRYAILYNFLFQILRKSQPDHQILFR